MGETLRGQQWTPALTLPHVRDGLSVLWMAVLCTFRRPSMGRSVHHEFMRTKLLALTTIVPATACHQRNYVEPYSRFTPVALAKEVVIYIEDCMPSNSL